MAGAQEKEALWTAFGDRVQQLLGRGPSALRGLSGRELSGLLDDYQRISADLARARSLGAPRATVEALNRLALAGHSLLYAQARPKGRRQAELWTAFARAVRQGWRAVATSAVVFFGTMLVTYAVVQVYPALGWDLVPPEFYQFRSASTENMHHIPALTRPVVSSAIIANNLQVTLLVFGLGLSFGVGTTLMLAYNGLHIGAVAGWLAHQGQARAFWGWVMPHGGTELLAICLAGGAGYLLAGALLMPGLKRRSQALQQVGMQALAIELGCMGMLLVAGLLEGFVSPSDLPYPARIVVLVGSLVCWGLYLLGTGHGRPGEAGQIRGSRP